MDKKVVKIVSVIIIFITVFCCGCAKKNPEQNGATAEVYNESVFQNLQTFTAITDIKIKEVSKTCKKQSYTYVISKNAEEKIDKYTDYLVDDCGFKLSDDSEDEMLIFTLSSKELIIKSEEIDGKTVVTVIIPFTNEVMNKNKEEIYQKVLSLCNEGKYKEAKEFFYKDATGEYKDILKIVSYCEAKELLSDDKFFFVPVIEELEKASGFKDADNIRKELEADMKSCNGIYHYKKSGGYLYSNYYVVIKDGEVALDLKKEKIDPNINVVYTWDLMKQFKLDKNGKKQVDSNGKPIWEIGIGSKYYDSTYPMAAATFSKRGDGKMQFYSEHMADFDSVYIYEGTYSKISSVPPQSR